MKEIRRLFKSVFPGGKEKAFTMSYDDGVRQDARLIEIMKKYGIKGTFNLNSGRLGYEGSENISGRKIEVSTFVPEEISKVYEGFEVATHGRTHSSLVNIGAMAGMELTEDRMALEAQMSCLVQGHAYPYGFFDGHVKNALRVSGIKYARTTESTHSFSLPSDFYEWNPTCHHGDPMLMKLAEEFCNKTWIFDQPLLFYLWGHSYEFDQFENWEIIEELLDYISGFKDQIWFASNIEIMEYMEAQKALEFSADCSMAHNPTGLELWFDAGVWAKKKIIRIAPGKTVFLSETYC